MSSRKRLKSCFVPQCSNNDKNNADLLFFRVPYIAWMREAWIEACGRNPSTTGLHSNFYCCQDHFDIEKDVRFFTDFPPKLKPSAIPHKFECQKAMSRPHTRKRLHRDAAESLPEKISRLSPPEEIESVEQEDLQTYLANRQAAHLASHEPEAHQDNQPPPANLGNQEPDNQLDIREPTVDPDNQKQPGDLTKRKKLSNNIKAEMKEEAEQKEELGKSFKDVLVCNEEILSEEEDADIKNIETAQHDGPVEIKEVKEATKDNHCSPRIFGWKDINSVDPTTLLQLNIKKYCLDESGKTKSNNSADDQLLLAAPNFLKVEIKEEIKDVPDKEDGQEVTDQVVAAPECIEVKEEPLSDDDEEQLSAERLTGTSEVNLGGKVICPQCTNVFDGNAELENHCLRVHTRGLKTCYSCHICQEFTTLSKATLEIHIKEHLLRCSQPSCAYVAVNQSKLVKHMFYTHRKGKAFRCPYCYFNTIEISYMAFHIDSVHKIKNFTCQCCQYKGNNIDNLLRHLQSKNHANEILIGNKLVTVEQKEEDQVEVSIASWDVSEEDGSNDSFTNSKDTNLQPPADVSDNAGDLFEFSSDDEISDSEDTEDIEELQKTILSRKEENLCSEIFLIERSEHSLDSIISEQQVSRDEDVVGDNANNMFDVISKCDEIAPTEWIGELDGKRKIVLGKVGMTSQTPWDFFKLLFTDEFFQDVIVKTNKNAAKLISSKAKQKSPRSWKILSRGDMYIFLGLMFHMGNINVSSMRDYWRSDPLYQFAIFHDNMDQDRFEIIMKVLSFYKKHTDETTTCNLDKVRLILDHINNVMNCVFSPSRVISADNSMRLWRGKRLLGKYVKLKTQKYKIYVLTDDTGLVHRVLTCDSKDYEIVSSHPRCVVDSLSSKFTEDLFGADNFFDGVPIVSHILKNEICCTGKLINDVGSKEVDDVDKKRDKGSGEWNDKRICVLMWKDKRGPLKHCSQVNDIYKNEQESHERSGNQLVEGLQVQTVQKSQSRIENNPVGVSGLDKLLGRSPQSRKMYRWYTRLGLNLMHMLLNNAYLLYKESNSKTTLKEFTEIIITNLIDKGNKYNGVRPLASMQPSQHYIDFLIDKGFSRKRCVWCRGRSIARYANTYCPDCPENPVLCVGECFKSYHVKKFKYTSK